MVTIVEIIVDMLAQHGVEYVFALPGGVTPFLIEEMYKRPHQFKVIIARHEGAGTVMADMYGRMTGKPGFFIGQGLWTATNGGFGIAEAFLAGIPMVILTEFSDWFGVNHHSPYQIGTGEYGAVDLTNIFKSYSKYTTIANSPAELLYGIQLAIKHSTTGRPGPAVVVSKWNVMMSAFESLSEIKPPLYPLSGYLRVQPPSISETDAIRIAELLIAAHNPAMICGRGVHAAKAYQEVQELAELLGMPVATSYMGKSSIPEIHPLAVGTIAGLGQKVANKVVRGADVLLTVGSALSADNTNNCSPDLINPMEQRIIHIDIEPRNAGWTYPITLGITSDAKLALRAIINVIQAKKPTIDIKGRQAKLDALKQSPELEFFTSKFFTIEDAPLNPERVVKAINDLIRPEDKIILDGGNNRMWFTKLFRTKSTNQLIGPGGAAGMAWCASAVITSSMIYTEGRSIGIIGDGGMLMALYNLETIKQYNANPIIVVLNNATYGNPRDYLSAKGAAYCDYDNVNFKKIGEAMCVNARRVTTIDELNSEFKNALENPQATILDVVVKPASHIRIKVM